MEKYLYKGINNKSNQVVRGELKANNIGELEVLLAESDILLINCKVERKSIFNISFMAPLTTQDLVTFFSHLEQLDSAGVSIIDSLDDIKNSESYPPMIRNMVQDLYEAVRNGKLFSEALSEHPKIFDNIFVGLIANGEKTGKLAIAFKSITEHLKWSDSIKKKTIKAIRYPLFSMVIMFLVMITMTNYVVPKVTFFLKEQSLELPTITIALMKFSTFMQNNTLLIIILIPIIIVIYKVARNIPEFALAADEFKLHIPIFGSIITKLDASRFCNFFAITFESGIGVLDCIESTKYTIDNLGIRESIKTIKQKISDGQSLAESIRESGHFTGLVVRMFKVGEDSGNMSKALSNIKFFYDQEVNDTIDKIVGMIQPTLVLIMGGMMMWITAAIFGPIYSSFSQL